MPKSFLDLDPHIRDKIYRYSGVTRPCPIDLNNEYIRWARVKDFRQRHPDLAECEHTPYPEDVRLSAPRLPSPPGPQCFCDPIPVQLLSCCQTIFREVGLLFWSQNAFTLLWPGSSRQIFQQLNPSCLPWIRSLHVRLGAIYLSPGINSDIKVLFTTISEKCRIGKLNFTLECEVDDSYGFKLLYHHYQKLYGLKSCAIRLAKYLAETEQQRETFSSLREEARQMVGFVTNRHTVVDDKQLWWHLPKELRVKILRLTGLVYQYHQGWEFDGILIQDGQRLADKGLRICCKQCSTSPSVVCCCKGISPAWSSTCTCYSVPYALFAVSRAFALEAREVFYRENRFIVRGDLISTASFFRRETPKKLEFFRNIDFQFETPQELRERATGLIYAGHPPGVYFQSLVEWTELLRFFASRFNIQAVLLSIDAGFALAWGLRQGFSKEDKRQMLKFFHALIRPLVMDTPVVTAGAVINYIRYPLNC